MKTIISILGPTASGKTSFALGLAKQALKLRDSNKQKIFSGVDFISADSRQVYKGLEVLSGADIPDGFLKVDGDFPFFEKESMRLYGVSILDFNSEWSVSHFKNFATKIIKNSFNSGRLPIIVGGTNLYFRHLFSHDERLYIPPSKIIREKAKLMSVKELQEWLKKESPAKFASMNNSDINNSRRLVRAIEIVLNSESGAREVLNLPDNINNLKIGILPSFNQDTILDRTFKKINERVLKRFEEGAIEEAKKLVKFCIDKKDIFPVCSTLGVGDINSYLKNEISKEQCLKNWALHEFQYAKRQLVWMKKEENIVWLDDLSKSSYNLSNEQIFGW